MMVVFSEAVSCKSESSAPRSPKGPRGMPAVEARRKSFVGKISFAAGTILFWEICGISRSAAYLAILARPIGMVEIAGLYRGAQSKSPRQMIETSSGQRMLLASRYRSKGTMMSVLEMKRAVGGILNWNKVSSAENSFCSSCKSRMTRSSQ